MAAEPISAHSGRAGALGHRSRVERGAVPRGDEGVDVELEPPRAGARVRWHRGPEVAAYGERRADRARIHQPPVAGEVELPAGPDRPPVRASVGTRAPGGRLV